MAWGDCVRSSAAAMAIASLCACANGASSTDAYSGFTGSDVRVEGGAGGDAASSGDSAASDDATAGEAADDQSSAPAGDASDDGGSSPPSVDDGGGMTSDAAQASPDAAGATDALAPDASDKCAPFGNTCSSCTQGRSGYECGWCNGCFTGTSSGPTSGGACAGAKWVWNSSNCP